MHRIEEVSLKKKTCVWGDDEIDKSFANLDKRRLQFRARGQEDIIFKFCAPQPSKLCPRRAVRKYTTYQLSYTSISWSCKCKNYIYIFHDFENYSFPMQKRIISAKFCM